MIATTSTEEICNPVYPPARRKLAEYGIGCAGKTARQHTNGDYEKYDLLMDYTDRPSDVADSWYTGDFETTWQDVLAGCWGNPGRLRGKISEVSEKSAPRPGIRAEGRFVLPG